MTFTKEQKTHHLKIYPEHFSAVLTGVKRAELRKNDRDFKVGDTLHLMETPKGNCNPTGEFVNAVVTHIADVGDWLPGYVLLSIEREPACTAPTAPVVPETLPCPVMLEPGLRFGKGVRTQTMLDALQRRAEYTAELEAMTPDQRADHDAGMKEFAAMLQGSPALHEETQRSKCWCRTCRPVDMTDMRFVACPECGNKRCPRANDCRNVCSGSNEPGQEGSAYPASPQQEA